MGVRPSYYLVMHEYKKAVIGSSEPVAPEEGCLCRLYCDVGSIRGNRLLGIIKSVSQGAKAVLYSFRNSGLRFF